MEVVVSMVLLGLCVLLLVAHFAEIKNSHKNNG